MSEDQTTANTEVKESQQLTIFEAMDNTVARLQKGGVTFTALGCRFQKGITPESASQIGATLIRMDQIVGVGMNFALGDWYNWVEETFPRKASQIITGMPEYKYTTIRNYGSIASRVPENLRTQALNWKVYSDLAPCGDKKIVQLLTDFRDQKLGNTPEENYNGLVYEIEAAQKLRVAEEQKAREKVAKQAEKRRREEIEVREGPAEPSVEAPVAPEMGVAVTSAEEDISQAEREAEKEPEVPQYVMVTVHMDTLNMIESSKGFIRKILKGKSKPSDAEVLGFVMKRFCSMNKIKVSGLIATQLDEPETPVVPEGEPVATEPAEPAVEEVPEQS